MSIVTTDNTLAFPAEAAAAQAQAEQAAHSGGLNAGFSRILRFVPGNRVIIQGTLDGAEAVFRLPLSAPALKQVTKEWAELTRTYAYMSSGPNRVAQPLHFAPESGLMATSFIPGTPLMKHLWSLDPAERAPVFAQAGDWLAAYTAPSQTTQPANLRHWLTRARDAVATQPHPNLAEVEQRVFRQMRHLSKRIGETDWRTAITHGDFHPNNLILMDGVLTGIDTGGSGVAPLTKDLARALTHMARRGLFFGPKRRFGMDALAFDALANALDLSPEERDLHLPYMICFETLIRVEHPKMPAHRVDHALEMATALLRDLRQIT